MSAQLWLGFTVASLIIGVVPGPGVMSIVGYAIGSGRKTALASVVGMALGNVMAMTLSLGGVGTLLAASALAFSMLKWAGAIYLVGLGVITIFGSGRMVKNENTAASPISPGLAFVSNVAIGTFHPKTIVFFVAFAPQFISGKAPYMPQAAILIATFGVVVGCTDTLYALAATRASSLLKKPRAKLWSARAGGGVLVAAGLATASLRK